MPTAGGSFGATVNAEAMICQADMFDFYDGGNLDISCLGIAAPVDGNGNLNVSKFGVKILVAAASSTFHRTYRILCFVER